MTDFVFELTDLCIMAKFGEYEKTDTT